MNQSVSSSSSESALNNALGHFRTITKHKNTVMGLCFKVGLIRQGLLHDLSKYTPVEFKTGVKYYRGDMSPNSVEKQLEGYSTAWLHHKGRNRHHFEYWIDVSYKPDCIIETGKMPLKYVLEMACDRIAASKIYRGSEYKESDPYEYLIRRASRVSKLMHPDTYALLESILAKLKDEGEEACIEYMRWLLKNPEEYGK